MRRHTITSVMCAPLLVLGCTGGDGGGPRPVEIVVDLQRGHPFTASGDAVDEGLFCESGQRWEVGHLDLDGETRLSLEEFVRRLQVAQETDGEVVEFLFEVELVCADGSGRIELVEQAMEWWQVSRGVGAYDGVTGEGTSSFERSGPPTEPDDPPEGMPAIARYRGTLERAAEP